MTHVESPWLPVQRVSVNAAARAVTGMNGCASFPGKNRKAVCGSSCCVCREQREFLPRAWEAVKTNQTALQHLCVCYQSEELCQLEELCWTHHFSHLFSLLGLAWIPTWNGE